MVPILNAGSTHPTRSHFDAQDFMERAAPGVKSVTEGWLNRYLTMTAGLRGGDRDGGLRAVALQSTLPRSLRGQFAVLATPDGGAEDAMDRFERLYDCDSNEAAKAKMAGEAGEVGGAKSQAGTGVEGDILPEEQNRQRILETGQESIAKLRELNRLIGGGGRDDAGFPRSRLGQQFRQTAELIKSNRGLEIAAFDYNGWDHHAYQGGADGLMADMLGDLSKSIDAFVKHLGKRMDRTLVLTMSEFGRTVRENGNAGTDHGRAGYMMAVGGMVNGDRFYGKWTGLERKSLGGRAGPAGAHRLPPRVCRVAGVPVRVRGGQAPVFPRISQPREAAGVSQAGGGVTPVGQGLPCRDHLHAQPVPRQRLVPVMAAAG